MLLLLKKSLMKEPGMVFSQIIDFVHLKVKRIYEPKLHFFIQENSFGGTELSAIQVV